MQRLLYSAIVVQFMTLTLVADLSVLAPGQPLAFNPSAGANELSEQVGTRFGASEKDRGLAALHQAILDITNPFSLLNVAVRPAEEDSGVLVYCRQKLGVQTGVVFATAYSASDCSEGRSRKLMEEALGTARAEDADTYFLNLPRAGAAKSADGVLSAWNHDVALARLVNAIRDFKPDVITTTAGPSSNDPESVALANLVLEAISKAADSTQSADSKLSPWKVARAFIRTGGSESSSVEINLNEYDTTRGESYLAFAEAARKSYRAHIEAITPFERYNLIYPASVDRSDTPRSFFEGISLPSELAAALKPPTVAETPMLQALTQREFLLDALVGTLAVRRLQESEHGGPTEFGDQHFRVVRFTDRVERAMALLLGLQFKLTLSDRIFVPGANFAAVLTLYNGSDKILPVEFRSPSQVSTDGGSSPDRSAITTVGQFGSVTQRFDFTLPQSVSYTLPRTLKNDTLLHYQPDETVFGEPLDDRSGPEFRAEARIGLGPIILPLQASVRYDVAAPFEISVSPSVALIKGWSVTRDINIRVRVVSHSLAPFTAELWVVQQALVNRDYEPVRLTFVHKDEELVVPMRLNVPLLKPPLTTDVLLELRRPSPAPPDPIVSARIEVRPAGVETEKLGAVGYISGTGDRLAFALSELGAEYVPLSTEDLQNGAIDRQVKSLRAILIGPGAYSIHSDLKFLSRRLLDFAARGGTIILFPQDPVSLAPAPGGDSPLPYPIRFSAVPISAPSLALVQPESELLSAPNKIAGPDINDWPGTCPEFFPEEWDAHYRCLIKQSGATDSPAVLLACDYGKGRFVYAGFTCDEALESMTPGIYKLLANLLRTPAEISKQAPPVYGPTD